MRNNDLVLEGHIRTQILNKMKFDPKGLSKLQKGTCFYLPEFKHVKLATTAGLR